MKNQITYTLFVLLFGMVMLSNSGGRGTAGGAAATMAPGEDGTFCGTCHNSGTFDTELSFQLLDEAGDEITAYVPGETYTARLTINATGTPAGYGFQMVSLDGQDEEAGEWSELPDNTATVSLLGRTYVEQIAVLDSPEIDILWTAPDAENVTFYAGGNAANGNFSTAGDTGVASSFSFIRDEMSSSENLIVRDLKTFPNPASDYLFFDGDNFDSVELVTAAGERLSKEIENNRINIQDLNNGIYIVKARKADAIFISKFIKI